MTIFQEFVDRARAKINPSHLTYSTVANRLTEANGFRKILNVDNAMLVVNPRFDLDNMVEPGTAEWIIQWDQWTGEFLVAPDTFIIWWNDPSDLKHLIEEGHYVAHREMLRRQDRERQQEAANRFTEQWLSR